MSKNYLFLINLFKQKVIIICLFFRSIGFNSTFNLFSCFKNLQTINCKTKEDDKQIISANNSSLLESSLVGNYCIKQPKVLQTSGEWYIPHFQLEYKQYFWQIFPQTYDFKQFISLCQKWV